MIPFFILKDISLVTRFSIINLNPIHSLTCKDMNMDKYLALDRALNEILTPVPTPFSTLFAGEIKAEC
nr:hypothetical protein [Salmonella enterica]AAF69913.1 orf; hypothetical protein [Salmonella enterica subsp. enterica serovar Typhi]